ncbi:MAG: manganese efflux pump MntP family protein [Spirochaetaceae bacterium]|jgi:putative Mn2+ efflux pump MntP|nr:manganese efflux pump MntP family protein [Spirochaetaceae bacterium]
MLSVVLIGLSLAMDAFAVSISSGITIRNLRVFHILRGSLFFGFFQFIMPLAGWYLGHSFSAYIEAFDHWIAFALLVLIGGKMIREGIAVKRQADGEAARGEGPNTEGREGEGRRVERRPADIRGLRTLVTLAVATSIDALAVGVSFSIMVENIWTSAALIGGITFFVCLTGFEFGIRLRRGIGFIFERWAPVAGGGVLLAIGVKILAEHLFF